MALSDFFKPKWKHSNPLVRKAALKQINKQNILVEVAKKDKSFEVRKEAIAKISNKWVINQLAEFDTDWRIRELAMERVWDPKLLNRVESFDFSSLVREKAKKCMEKKNIRLIGFSAAKTRYYQKKINEVSDQNVLVDVAKNYKHWEIRKVALAKIKDQELLVNLGEGEEPFNVRITAFRALGNIEKPNKGSVEALIRALNIEHKELKKVAALGLSKYARHSPELLLENWDSLAKKINQHKDLPAKKHPKHIDYHKDIPSKRSMDCNHVHTDTEPKWERLHKDIGIGGSFPKKPPKL